MKGNGRITRLGIALNGKVPASPFGPCLGLWLPVALLLVAPVRIARAEEPVSFNRDIRPIMSDTCFKCHGPATQEAGLRLDSPEHALKPTDSGVVPIVPGDPEKSEVIRRIFSDDPDVQMPPPSSHKTLTDAQKQLIRRWIAEGAQYQPHWAFIAPVRVTVPAVAGQGVNPVDAFLLEKLHKQGLDFSPEADRYTLIRRLAFTLTGLPPTLDEVERFVRDTRPDAYERMVDYYLASPAFGEEMARHWLDAARYGDTHGLHLDNERQMWAYRDWVIQAFNRNLPFDQFTIEQLAGDLLPNATTDQLVATGFNRCNVTTGEGGSIVEEWLFRNAVDRTVTMGQTWLGLTIGCCVCHDHKYDPITSREFYSLYAFFYSSADPALDGNALLTAPTIKLMTDEDRRRLAEWDRQLADVERELEAKTASILYVDPATVDPRPEPRQVEWVWFDDTFPAGASVKASPGHPTELVGSDRGQVFSGSQALKRSDTGLAQDVFENTGPLEIPPQATLFAYVWIDPQDVPRTLMLQYYKNGWLHRAVWGDYEAIDWGRKNTTERVLVGAMVPAGQWVKLEVPAERLGLKAGDVITGFALTQFGGTVYWDRVGVIGVVDPANDPRYSFLAWWRENQGKELKEAPQELRAVIKNGPEAAVDEQLRGRLRNYYVQQVCIETREQLRPLLEKRDQLRKQRNDYEANIPGTFIFRDLEQPRQAYRMVRGQYDRPGEPVEPDVPGVLPPLRVEPPGRRPNRLDLAHWLVQPGHPLTARVAVNRFWQQVFGTGLVKTSWDFGVQGEPPSHPELLDWLAIWFQESGWDVKRLMRLLVTTRAFRQSSAVTAELLRRDPENRLYGRGPRIRLDAEQIRDNSLAVSGLLVRTMGGRGDRPYQPPNIWEPIGFVGSNTANYVQDHGAALYRRSIYVFLKRTAPPPFMSNFDAPSREAFCPRRERTNTPLQALQLLNDVQHVEAARVLAQRICREGGQSPVERIGYAFRLVLARPPEPVELEQLVRFFHEQWQAYQERPEKAGQLISFGESPPDTAIPAPELAAYTLVCNLLLNLDETIMRN
ncbi:MAG: peptidyl-prolyl cis-trans isomerase [Pirellulaceae bacterium]|nr:MAG: peptidyl-prolyl cis-trans isomerase [Pirellulaceae bacterium]